MGVQMKRKYGFAGKFKVQYVLPHRVAVGYYMYGCMNGRHCSEEMPWQHIAAIVYLPIPHHITLGKAVLEVGIHFVRRS